MSGLTTSAGALPRNGLADTRFASLIDVDAARTAARNVRCP